MEMDKVQREHLLEEIMVGLGVDRYNKSREGGEEAELPPGKSLVHRSVPKLSSKIEEFVKECSSGKAGRRHTAAQYLECFIPDVAAFVTSRWVINSMIKNETLTKVSISIGTSLEDHVRFVQFSKHAPGLLRHTEDKIKKSTHARYRQGVLKHALKLVPEAVGLGWTNRDKLLVGSKLVELFIEATGLATVHLDLKGKMKRAVIRPTDKVKEWLEKRHEEASLLAPVYMPMILKPRDWTNPKDGGYLNRGLFKSMYLIKTKRRDTLDELFSVEMPEVYNAVNAIQRTAWRINRKVYDVMKTLRDQRSSLGGLPIDDDDPVPPRPSDIPEDVPLSSLSKEEQKRLKQWKAAAAEVYTNNAKKISKRLAFAQQMFVASRYVDEEEIYFPYTMDFRGRIYAQPTGLNPQGDDKAKSLLEFARGKPLGDAGAFWLAVHVANCFGEADKLPLSERVRWTLDHEELILDSARNPLDGERFWTSANGGDSAWTALAACFEWSGYVESGLDPNYMCHIPVAVDGSCSGLQHFSAMLRDEIGGTAVNLTPSDECHDIYSEVAKRVEEYIKRATDEAARRWRGKVVRKIVKQPCMTFAYSVTSRGIRDQIIDALKKLDDSGNYLDGLSYFEAANYLSPIVERCIRETVIAASGAMEWLQEVATLTARDGVPLYWTTPVGMPVLQDERKYTSKRVKVWFQGKKRQLSLACDTEKIDANAQRSGIAPNFIHSMDAAHLMRTVNTCTRCGITSFAMIHDSFGTHACDIPLMNAILREEFIAMYSEDILMSFKKELLTQLSPETAEKIPEIPPKGSLNLEGVKESVFFFS